MTEEIKVSISDYKVSRSPNKLVTLGLGSCVGVAIYDRATKIGGLSHIMLPDSTFFSGDIKAEKFADLAIPMMVYDIIKGKKSIDLIAKIAGGASMFNFSGKNDNESIGTRKLHQWKNPDTFISPLINSPGHGTNIKKTYKRVNAIDQSSNEGKPTIMTNTQVLNAIWTSFYLYRVINGEMIKVPLNAKRSDSMYCPYKEGFIVSKIKTNDGSSIVNIITEEGMKK